VSDWPPATLDALEGDEIRFASYRLDGTLRTFVRIWFVRSGDELFVRSAYGPDNGWYRRALASGAGRIRGTRWEGDVQVEPSDDEASAISDAYRAKYGRYPPGIVATVLTPDAERCTLRLRPR